jgi:hypothetical protein
MERKFYPENFENFLKGHADQFKLTPSKKVWHGIYNDLHPGRRWPSVAMTMVFLFTLVIIGHLNTNNGNASRAYDPTAFDNNPDPFLNHSEAGDGSRKANGSGRNNTPDIAGGNPDFAHGNNVANGFQPLPQAPIQSFYNTVPALPVPMEGDADNTLLKSKSSNLSAGVANTRVNSTSASDLSISPADREMLSSNDALENTSTVINKETSPATKEVSSAKQDKQEPRANATNIRKPARHSDITWTYYLAPSISYRNFSDASINDAVTHKPALGYEGGVSMSFNVYKKLQFTAGLQVNYSGYRILANNTHPIVATLVLNTDIQGQYSLYSTMSQLGNSVNSEFTKLKNYSLQASLPFGLQYDFAGNANMKFGIMSAFQPSLVIASKAYVLSEDKRNYLTNPSLVRKWNMNTSLTPYVSFTSNSLRWQIGPQVRYQLLSTYTNQYPVKEHLINYGIRVGISKISK